MKRFLYAVALAALFASAGTAEEKVVTSPTTAAPVVIASGSPVVESAPAQSTRRGLFGRLRNRNSGSTMNYSPAPAVTVPTTATPMPPISAPQPMPMPGTRTGAMMMPPSGAIVQASGNLPPGVYTTTDGTVIQIGGPATASSDVITTGGPIMTDSGVMPAGYTEPAQSGRRGLFSRLRSR
jgi:hypothetical protein